MTEAEQWKEAYENLRRYADSIYATLSAERIKAQGLVEGLRYARRFLKIGEHDTVYIDALLTPYASAADDRGNGNGNS